MNKSARFQINPKSLYTSRDEGFDENSVSTTRKMLPLLTTEKIDQNWLTPNFRNAYQQQKKNLNKSTRFKVTAKSVYTSRDEGFDENSASTVRN